MRTWFSTLFYLVYNWKSFQTLMVDLSDSDGCFFHVAMIQPMVNCWFGLVVWIPGINPNQQLTITP